MKPNPIICILLLFSTLASTQAALSVKVDEPTPAGSKAIVKLTMKNNWTNAVQSARAAVFVFDDAGKVVGQKAEWVIGGTRAQPGLAADATATFNVVVGVDKPFKSAQVTFMRIILENGQIIDAGQGYAIEKK